MSLSFVKELWGKVSFLTSLQLRKSAWPPLDSGVEPLTELLCPGSIKNFQHNMSTLRATL